MNARNPGAPLHTHTRRKRTHAHKTHHVLAHVLIKKGRVQSFADWRRSSSGRGRGVPHRTESQRGVHRRRQAAQRLQECDQPGRRRDPAPVRSALIPRENSRTSSNCGGFPVKPVRSRWLRCQETGANIFFQGEKNI